MQFPMFYLSLFNDDTTRCIPISTHSPSTQYYIVYLRCTSHNISFNIKWCIARTASAAAYHNDDNYWRSRRLRTKSKEAREWKERNKDAQRKHVFPRNCKKITGKWKPICMWWQWVVNWQCPLWKLWTRVINLVHGKWREESVFQNAVSLLIEIMSISWSETR